MAGHSADMLAELAIGGPRAPDAARLVRQLALDPPLALWTLCTVHSADVASPRALPALAEWLLEHPLEALGTETAGTAETKSADEPPPQFDGRVKAGLLAAEIYAAMANAAPANEGYLLALLHNAADWADLAHGGLPDWLVDWTKSASTPQTIRAAKLAQSPDDTVEPSVDLAGCRERADRAGSQWLMSGEWSNPLLSALAARLARLAELETRFERTLEHEKLESMAEFAAGAGHEINNPLAVIAGRAQLFLREEKDPERRRGLALINAQAMRVYEMIADMRLFARPPVPERKDMDLARLVDTVVHEMAPRAAEQETAISRLASPEMLTLHADPVQLSVALRALIANSLEALGHGGRVQLEFGRQAAEIFLRVVDDGPGIAPKERLRIFDPFFSARQAGRGLGIGLGKCWQIVTHHGGRIDVESQPGQGATFTIRLPE